MNMNKILSFLHFFKIYLLKVWSELFVCETACLHTDLWNSFTLNKEKHLQCGVSPLRQPKQDLACSLLS